MKKGIFFLGLFVFLSVSFAASMMLYSGDMNLQVQQKVLQQRKTLMVLKPSVTSVTPQKAVLTQGGDTVIVEANGANLGVINSAQVLRAGNAVTEIEVTLDKSLPGTLKVSLKATPTAPIANDYQLAVFDAGNKKLLDVPTTVLAIEVVAPVQKAAVAQQATTAGPPSKQAASKQSQASTSALRSSDSRTIRSGDFNSVASGVFKDAYFHASSCGGRDSERKTTASVPNAYFKQEPLDRMEYKFTDGEKDRSNDTYRVNDWRVAIRACVDSWKLIFYDASIEGERFKILFRFSEIQAIKTRAMEEAGRIDRWDWSEQDADNAIQDFRFSGGLDIFLTPVVQNGSLSYSLADARWTFYEPLTGWIGPGYFRLPNVEEPKISYYKDTVLEVIRQRAMTMLSDASVRARLSEALTQRVKSGEFAGRTITEVSGTGDRISVTFKSD